MNIRKFKRWKRKMRKSFNLKKNSDLYFKNRKRLKELIAYINKYKKCLLCFSDVEIGNVIYSDYRYLQVFDNNIIICEDCYKRFKIKKNEE